MYLAQNGMTEQEFERALGAPEETLSEHEAWAPAWLDELRQAYADPKSEPFEPPPGEEEIGFLNLIDPILEQALYQLWQEVERLLAAADSVPFDPETVEDVLLMNLPDQIIQRLGRTLVLELNVLRLQDGLVGENPRDRFLDFVGRLRDPEFVGALFDEYPVLARQLALCIRQWLNVSLECLTRLCADWELLKVTFGGGEDPGPLVRLAGGAGDTHRRGRSVMIAEFESGLRIVYKPKSLAIDIHFQDLLDWLNEVGCVPSVRTFTTLDRIEYGWAEFVERSECGSLDGLRRFYQRQGVYLALLHVLASTDFHFENVIAAGEYPMLIDLETMLQPLFERFDESDAESLAQKHMAESVLSIGLLPMRIWSGDDYQGIDISGLGGAGGQLSPDRIPSIADQGTDAMHYVRERMEIDGDANRPVLEGTEANAIEYIDDIVAGFEGTYRLVMQHREDLLRPDGLIEAFAEDSIRVLMRPTRTYGQLLYESFHPDMLRDAVDRGLFLDRLWLVVPERNHMKEIIASEQEDILQGDIPVFTSYPSSLDLFDAADQALPGVLTVRGIDNVRQRIEEMSEEDLQRQAWYIRASVGTVAPEGYAQPSPDYLAANQNEVRAFSTDGRPPRVLEAIRAAADYLCSSAHESENDVTWVGLQAQGEQYWAIATLGLDLYNGSPGIALFLAYAGEMLREQRYTDLARKAYDTILIQCEFASDSWSAIGAFEGWGGILRLFTQLGALWQDDEISAQADRIANRIWGYIEDNDAYDVVRGSAGAIQSLLDLNAVRPSGTAVRIAELCGGHLLEAAEPQSRGIGWAPARFGNQALTGYAHGASGIAASLFSLHIATGDDKYRIAAEDALQYERSMFDREAGNWPDVRGTASYDKPAPYDGGRHYTAWCRGSAGIGLARLQMLGGLSESANEAIFGEVESALAATLRHGFGQSHCLCHGDLGALEFLHQASCLDEWTGRAHHVGRLTNTVVDSIEGHGWQCGGPGGVLMPGLMLGIAGIGYQLLRLAEPDAVPSIIAPASTNGFARVRRNHRPSLWP